jgi:hypothetical protein
MVGGYILVSFGIYSLLQNSSVLDANAVLPVSIGLILFLSLFVSYYFYHVFGSIQYIFDKKDKTLSMQFSNIFGGKTKTYPLDHIRKVETRIVPTFSYAGSVDSHARSVYTKQSHHDYYSVVVLKIAGKEEINLTPNAAYFFLHPFDTLTNEIDKGLGVKIAEFLGVPFQTRRKKQRQNAL